MRTTQALATFSSPMRLMPQPLRKAVLSPEPLTGLPPGAVEEG